MILIAIILILISVYFYYKSTKDIRSCVAYSKNNNLDILGFNASHEILLLSNILFITKLVKVSKDGEIMDSTQNMLLVSSKEKLIKALAIGLIAQVFIIGGIYAH